MNTVTQKLHPDDVVRGVLERALAPISTDALVKTVISAGLTRDHVLYALIRLSEAGLVRERGGRWSFVWRS